MRVVVTGGAGFIGSWVVDALIEAGHTVAVLDDLSTGDRTNLNPSAEFKQIDIRDARAVSDFIGQFKPDAIDHHAAQVNVRKSADDPAFDAEVNIIGTINLLKAARAYNVKRFLFASSVAIYGEPTDLPIGEETPAAPGSPYGISKYASENYIRFFSEQHGMEAVVFRYANIYGPRQSSKGEAGVVATFCTAAIEGKSCTIFGDGEQTRDYVFVKDIARANLKGLNGPPGTYNLGNGNETSVNELVTLLGNAMGRKVAAEHVAARNEEIRRSAMNASHANTVLSWQGQTNLQDGLKQTAQWFKEHG